MKSDFSKPIWTARVAAEFFDCSVQSVYDMRDAGTLKQLIKLPGVRFRRADCLVAANETEDVFRPFEVARMRRELALEKKKNARLVALLYKLSSEITAEISKGGEKEV